MLFSIDDIRRSFDERTFSKARAYANARRVTNLRFDPPRNAASANVQGSAAKPYAVRLEQRERGTSHVLRGECSCPIGRNCKHAAGLALFIADGGAEKGASNSAVDAWAREIASAFHAAAPARDQERLAYAIDVTEAHGLRAFRLRAYVISGAKPREYALYNLAASKAKFVTAADRVAGRLATASGLAGMGYDLSPAIVALLLEELIKQRRLHWHGVDAPALARVPVSGAGVTWTSGDDGLLRVHLAERPHTVLLPTAPLWYVDPQQGCAGPVATDVPEEPAAILARSPALSAEQAERVQVALHAVFQSLRVDGPARDIAGSIDASLPQRVLQLDALRGGRAGAELRFAYGDELVAARDPRDVLRETNGARILPRDRTFEQRAEKRLNECGFLAAGGEYTLPNEDAWLRFLERDVPELVREGWDVRSTPSFPYRIAEAGEEWSADAFDSIAPQWFELELGIDVEGRRISLLPVLIDALDRVGLDLDADPATLARRQAPFVGRIPGGGYVALPAERVARVLATLGGLFGARPADRPDRVRVPILQAGALGAASGVVARWNHAPAMRALFDDLAAFAERPVEIPPSFAGALRPYQREGVGWLQALRAHRAGGILADDMGLGKTVEVLAHAAVEREAGRLVHPMLVIAPTSVTPNWRAEIERFLPGARVLTLTGADRAERYEDVAASEVVLTSYALLVRDAEQLARFDWSIAVLDEAQAIKNPRSKAALAAGRLRAGQRIALTGTPIENHLEELWSIFEFAVPGLLPERARFTRLFRTPIEKHGDSARRASLGARIKPFLLRRTKDAVAQELPPKTEIVQRIELGGRQRDLYETIRLAMHKRVRDEVARRGLGRSRIVVLDALLKLRQVCCDPRLVKLEAAQGVTESQKLDALMEMLESLVDDGRRVLLFSQFTSMLDLIEARLDERSQPYVELRGSTRDRETPVARFQRGEVPLFLISLKAGGTGLNLTAADTVVHYDPWWNPAVERQATDRAHRIGQKQHIFVYKLIAENTVEERILELQERKGALAAGLLDEAQEAPLALSLEDLDRLFS